MTQQSDKLGQIKLDTPEENFCDKFFGLEANLMYQSEFRKRVEVSSLEKMNWDFWTGEKSYGSALDKMRNEIANVGHDEAKELYVLTNQIIIHHQRFGQNSTKDVNQDEIQFVIHQWTQIGQKLMDKLDEPDPESLFVIGVLLCTGIFASIGAYWYLTASP